MKMAEDKRLISLEGSHPLWSWVCLHAVWLINRFSANRALQATPFELATGRRYAGKVVCFREYVMLLQRQPGVKQGPQWLPGIWVARPMRRICAWRSSDEGQGSSTNQRTMEVKAKPYRNLIRGDQ